jgi:hypothetical protein
LYSTPEERAGSARFIGLSNWLPRTSLASIRAAETGEETVSVLDIDCDKVAVIVTTYDDDPLYFQVHPVCSTAHRVINGASATTADGYGLSYYLFVAIAKAIGAPDGWHVKAPSGTDWLIALKAYDRANKPL